MYVLKLKLVIFGGLTAKQTFLIVEFLKLLTMIEGSVLAWTLADERCAFSRVEVYKLWYKCQDSQNTTYFQGYKETNDTPI